MPSRGATHHANLARRSAEQQALLVNDDLATALLKLERLRVYSVRKFVPESPTSQSAELEHDAQTAICFGYIRVLLSRFRQDYEIKDDEIVDAHMSQIKHKEGVHLKEDTLWDYKALAERYPELEYYYPEEPIMIHEVLQAARKELYKLICGPGTDYYYNYRMQAYRRIDSKEAAEGGVSKYNTRGNMDYFYQNTGGSVSSINMSSHERGTFRSKSNSVDLSDDAMEYHLRGMPYNPDYKASDTSDSTYLLGKQGTWILVQILRLGVYPRHALYYIMERAMIPGKQTALIRAMGNTAVYNYEATKRDVNRKLRKLDAFVDKLIKKGKFVGWDAVHDESEKIIEAYETMRVEKESK